MRIPGTKLELVSPFLADTHPTFIDDADKLMRSHFPDGFDGDNPEHVARLAELAGNVDVNAPIDVSGDAVDTTRPVTRSVFADGELTDSSRM